MSQLALRFDEDFIESCKDHDQVEFGKCYGCHLTFPETDLEGGFCETCRDKREEDGCTKPDRLDKGPGPARPGGFNQVPAMNRRAL